MSLYESWKQMAEIPQTPQQQSAYWEEYFALETENYKKILANKDTVYEGSLKELADVFDMDEVVFTGFMDGINTSLKQEVKVEKLKNSTPLRLEVDFEKLFFNMLDAKAKWLYELPEWEDVLPEERRQEIRREWRASGQAVSEKTVGRNDPCPCKSGLKYKKCCGR